MVSAMHQQLGPFIPDFDNPKTPDFCNPPPFAPPIQPLPYVKQMPDFGLKKPDLNVEILRLVKECLERLDRLDKHFGLKDCSAEAAEKAAFASKLDKLIADAEALKK